MNWTEKQDIHLKPYNDYIEKLCPWCGNEGYLHETDTGSIFVKCKGCGASHPYGRRYVPGFIPKGKEKETYKEVCRAAAEAWNVRYCD